MKKIFTNFKKRNNYFSTFRSTCSSVGNSGANVVRTVGEVVIKPVEID